MTHQELIRELSIVGVTFQHTIDALDDASGVVDAGENEQYAYQQPLEAARAELARLNVVLDTLRAERHP
ncbi:hypothetical protein [Deinococcus soli (ex Cha et al. 2016)]|uniref:Uncharacterized protein n=2 Tax=Deinococcus soli (ex Cha et al. 2016) TaxID=1309411 RepID=A0AAE3XC44_9DEIO|nr:hypothetical protein [Deinococcus soli (ex Cha et al. 2016)]MDR6218219.1 hypothetical protein [Deinococcus soli (ex Cha et al. 2016)]MDR6328959.1 hypothetical protein [Deinococcus soli (ex Cha et al. 2016)]MDR6751232.1 hypothetical protein [Deinococcus soli (ex Cha et al. 2016)]